MSAKITTQSYQRPGRAVRWGYVLTIPGEPEFVSHYRYGSEDAARRAGEADLRATLELIDKLAETA